MRVEGNFEVAAGVDDVYRELNDVALMARCIPGCLSIERADDVRYRARVGVGLGAIQATFDLVVEILEADPPLRVVSRTRGDEGGRASMVAADNVVLLQALADNLTRVQYTSDVSVTGRLGKFALGVMKKKVEALGAEFALRFRSEISARVGPPGGA